MSMKIHSTEAWEIASHWSWLLASDTRTLAAMVDNLVNNKLEEAASAIDKSMTANDAAKLIREMKHV